MPCTTARMKWKRWRRRSSRIMRSMKRLAIESVAEVVLLGGNYDDSITLPAVLREATSCRRCATTPMRCTQGETAHDAHRW